MQSDASRAPPCGYPCATGTDETGIGYWEQVPGQTPGGDGSFENPDSPARGVRRRDRRASGRLSGPDEGETSDLRKEQKAAADAI